MAEITIFKGSTGINTRVDPTRLRYDPETGVQDLAEGVNVDIGPTGRINRRKGYTATTITANCHSLFCQGGDCLFVTGNALCVLDPDFTYTAIRTVTPGARMSYVQVADEIYYANGYEVGVVRAGNSYEWGGRAYVGPTTMKQITGPPIGHLLEIYRGRMYVAQASVLWHSEPFAYAWFDRAANYIQFESRIRMIRAIRDGLYVSTEKNTYFLGGAGPKEFSPELVADYPAIEGTDTLVNGSLIGSGELTGRVAMWASTKGLCMGGPEGYFRNLTERKLDYPEAQFGAGAAINDRYICLLEP